MIDDDSMEILYGIYTHTHTHYTHENTSSKNRREREREKWIRKIYILFLFFFFLVYRIFTIIVMCKKEQQTKSGYIQFHIQWRYNQNIHIIHMHLIYYYYYYYYHSLSTFMMNQEKKTEENNLENSLDFHIFFKNLIIQVLISIVFILIHFNYSVDFFLLSSLFIHIFFGKK